MPQWQPINPNKMFSGSTVCCFDMGYMPISPENHSSMTRDESIKFLTQDSKPVKIKKRMVMRVRAWLWTIFLAVIMFETIWWLPTLYRWLFGMLSK